MSRSMTRKTAWNLLYTLWSHPENNGIYNYVFIRKIMRRGLCGSIAGLRMKKLISVQTADKMLKDLERKRPKGKIGFYWSTRHINGARRRATVCKELRDEC